MVYGLERIGARWDRERGGARMGVGDISLMNGGDISGHVSHEKGVDVDVRPQRTSGEGPVTRFMSTYSRTRTAALQRLFRAELPVTLMLFNDTRIAGTTRWPNHDNHFHCRISQ
jgi:murein endopeptidase